VRLRDEHRKPADPLEVLARDATARAHAAEYLLAAFGHAVRFDTPELTPALRFALRRVQAYRDLGPRNCCDVEWTCRRLARSDRSGTDEVLGRNTPPPAVPSSPEEAVG